MIDRDELIRMAEEYPAVPVEWTEEKQREYSAWWESLTEEEQEFWMGSPFT